MNISKKIIKMFQKNGFLIQQIIHMINTFFKISNKTGIIFFYEEKKRRKKFLEKIKPYILWCQNKGINFFIQKFNLLGK